MDATRPAHSSDWGAVMAVMRRVIGDDAATLREWRSDPIRVAAGSGFTAGVYRVSGTASAGGNIKSWSAVCKVVRRPAGADAYDDPAGTPYWRREACVYESGLLADMPAGGISAPRCVTVVARDEDTTEIWLEDLPNVAPSPWPPALYRRTARRLGRFNGAYLGARPLPSEAWLAIHPLRAWVADQRTYVALVRRDDLWQHPLLLEAFPRSVRVRLLRLWQERRRFLAALAALPQTLCHFDAAPHNLHLVRDAGGVERLIAIDWEMAGIAAIGEEIGIAATATVLRGVLEAGAIRQIHELLFDGYLEGLRDAGWHGDRRLVRLGFAANAALRWVFRAPALREIAEPERRAREEHRWGRPFEELLAGRAALTYALLDLADEARTLLAER